MTDLKIVDPHVHFWDLERNYYPWLNDRPLIPFRYGDYSKICRTYLPADYKRDAAGHDVVKTVYIEAEWDPSDPIGEMDYIAGLRRETGWPNATIGQAWLDRDDRAEVVERLAGFEFVRGLRHKPPRPNAGPGQAGQSAMADEHWLEGYALLREFGLHFELQTPWWHLGEAGAMADRFPDIPIVLLHSGLPADRSPEGLAGWKAAMAGFAERPNVAVKISGIGLPGVAWTADNNRAVVRTIIETFGVDRCMFASNFPVDSVCGDFDTIFSGYKEITSDLGIEAQAKLFHDNAVRYYGLG
ncbi:amidohydrolase family protein [Microbaculum marinum]|uniref:Amidohydrolase family protein n=1 Tax=Microbaculum marinum TaxID=1764581 RepID=A0AAW9RJI2_9HYPH